MKSLPLILAIALLSGCAFGRPSTPSSVFLNTPDYLLTFHPQSLGFSIARVGSPETILTSSPQASSSRASVKISPSPDAMNFEQDDGGGAIRSLSVEAISRHIFKVTRSAPKTGCLKEEFSDSEGEQYYGVWEDISSPTLNNRGVSAPFLYHKGNSPTAQSANARAPFYFSSKMYGIYIPSSSTGEFSFARHGVTSFCFDEAPLSYFIFLGEDYKSILKSYNQIAGPARISPSWAYGPHFWRDEASTNRAGAANATENIRMDLAAIKKNNIPITSMWIDRPYGTGSRGWGNFDFNDKFPGIQALSNDLKKENIRLVAWIANRSDANLLKEAIKQKYLFQRANHRNWPAADLRSLPAQSWFKDKLATFAHLGFSGFKIDRGDEGEMPDFAANELAIALPKISASALKEYVGDDYFLISRNANDLARSYTAIWSGDPKATFATLRASIVHGLRAGLINFPMWGSDTGGYGGIPTAELLIRWIQFSAFSPIMEVIIDHQDKILWRDFGKDTLTNLSRYARIHQALLPYLEAQMKQSAQSGTPLMRPLFLEFPGDPASKDITDEYLLGDSILVAPVIEEGASSRRVYFPPGKWTSLLGPKKQFIGGQEIVVPAPLDTIPVFLKEGGRQASLFYFLANYAPPLG